MYLCQYLVAIHKENIVVKHECRRKFTSFGKRVTPQPGLSQGRVLRPKPSPKRDPYPAVEYVD